MSESTTTVNATENDAQALMSQKHVTFFVDPKETIPPEKEPIDWECPCLGDLKRGPCAPKFKKAFECVHYASSPEQKQECVPLMQAMAECVQQNRDQYQNYANVLDEMAQSQQ